MTNVALLLATVTLAGSIGIARQAHASCGDWLDHAAMSQNPSPTKTAAQQEQSTSKSDERPAPCRGPECGRGPVQPLLPPTPVEITFSSSLKAGIPHFAAADPVLTKHFAQWLTSSATPLHGYPASIDRPPRG